MKHVLITGGAGFIGYHLARYLVKTTDHSITIVDNFSRGRADADLQALIDTGRVTLITADLSDPQSYQRLPTNIDHLYHLAATNGTKFFYERPYELMRQDTLLNIHLLDWITTLSHKPKLLYTSTCETYAGALESFGQLPIPTPENVPRVISDIFNPRWSYAVSKVMGEMLTIHYAQKHGLSAIVVDPHNFYGPRSGYEHVIPEIIERIGQRLDPFPLYGGVQTRAFCYIEDAAQALALVMESDKTNGQPVHTFHIGDPTEHSIQEVAEQLFIVAGWTPAQVVDHAPPKGSVMRRAPDPRKIEQMLGWKATTSLAEGLRKSYEWYKEHPKPLVKKEL